MKRDRVKQLFTELKEREVLICGWVKTNRSQSQFGFLNVNDGSTVTTLQVVYDEKLSNFEEISKIRVGSSVLIEGKVVLTPELKQPLELHAAKVELIGDADESFPIQP